MDKQQQLQVRLAWLRTEHGDLDHAIERLSRDSTADTLTLARLKKRKLAIRDEIAWIEDQLLPDIIA